MEVVRRGNQACWNFKESLEPKIKIPNQGTFQHFSKQIFVLLCLESKDLQDGRRKLRFRDRPVGRRRGGSPGKMKGGPCAWPRMGEGKKEKKKKKIKQNHK